MWDNPDSFYNGAHGSDILHALEKVNRKVTDKDVRKFMSNIREIPIYANKLWIALKLLGTSGEGRLQFCEDLEFLGIISYTNYP